MFMTPHINLVSCLRIHCGTILDSIHSNIQRIKGINTHNNDKAVMFTEVFNEIFNLDFKLISSDNV